MITKEEVLQKANDYCTEKQYNKETLSDAFMDKFADHFAKAYTSEEASIEDESILSSMKFALNTAWSSASQLATDKTKAFETKENEYKATIEELNKKIANFKPQKTVEIPDEVNEQLKELKAFKNEQLKQEKFSKIQKLAKEGIREDLHNELEILMKDYEVKMDKDDKEQAQALIERVKELFKGRIKDITPLKSHQTLKRDEEILDNLPKIKV